MKRKVAIIGGGVSGLTAGIYAQMCGFESVVYEQHTIVGGELTGWNRQGCHIDNCVHWLIGTSPDSDVFHTWCETAALRPENDDIIQNEAFMRVEMETGEVMSLWQDLDRLERDMLALSPEDEQVTRQFIASVKAYRCVELPAKTPSEQIPLKELWRLLRKMKGVARLHKKYSRISIGDYAAGFKNPTIRKMLMTYYPSQYNISSLMYVMANFSMGNAALPRGGSLAMAKRMEQRYLSLGGVIKTSHKAAKIDVQDKMARSVIFENGETATFDDIVCACDTDITFRKLIGEQYMDKLFRLWYMLHRKYPVHSSINFYFDVADRCIEIPDTVFFECAPYVLAGEVHQGILLKNFNSEPTFAPDGHTVFQTLHLQYSGEFEYWSRLRKTDIKAYRAEKERVAAEIIERLEAHYPYLKGKIKCVEVVTPASFNRYCGAYKGAYMSFILTPYVPKTVHKGRLKNIKNLYLAGQWIQPPGGLPNAHLTGKFAIQRLCIQEKIPFVGYGGKRS